MTSTLRGEGGGGVLKMGIIINKRHFVFFLDNCTHNSTIEQSHEKPMVRLQLNQKKSKETLMS